MKATTIQEVIDQLDQIIQQAKTDQSTVGYFAALYRKVTKEVQLKIQQNFFDDNPRMERLDVVFANRYLEAFNNYKQGKPVTQSWTVAIDASKNSGLIVLQHLVVGMNAHINLDLGIAAAQISDTSTIEDLHPDFNKINDILGALLDQVEDDLSEIWPTLLKMLRFFKKVDDFLINFSMSLARDGAWAFAKKLVFRTPSESLEELITERDLKIAKLGTSVVKPGALVRFVFWIIRISERGTVSSKILALEQ